VKKTGFSSVMIIITGFRCPHAGNTSRNIGCNIYRTFFSSPFITTPMIFPSPKSSTALTEQFYGCPCWVQPKSRMNAVHLFRDP